MSFFMFIGLLMMNLLFTNYGLITDSVLNCWLCLEMSMITFMGVIISNKLITNKSLVIYFSVQVMPSILFLAFQLMSRMSMNNYYWVLSLILFLKLGAAPFHSWYMSLASQLPLFGLIWLLTIQKLIPLQMMAMVYCKASLSWLILISTVVSTSYLVLQTKLFKFIIASSVFSNNWVLSSMLVSSSFLWQKYFFIYSALLAFMVYMWESLNMEKLFIYMSSNNILGWWVMGMFILGGFPPGPVFFIKIFILQSLVSQSFAMLALGLIIGSTISLLAVCNCVLLTQMGVSYKFFSKPKGYSLIEISLFLMLLGALTIFSVSLSY